jgi:oxygen-independent coproporphyrinogen-3 oxidase
MTSIRTMDGIDLELIENRFGAEKAKKIKSESQKFILSEKMITTSKHLILTEKGKLFADAITASLFFE